MTVPLSSIGHGSSTSRGNFLLNCIGAQFPAWIQHTKQNLVPADYVWREGDV